ncbi:MAG: HAMP domain-containing sensor histidine kinase [Rubricoccaceae bacterium]|nr:HAMP domain-containing sensor histidine kinase [Rubricoccaceae bacterium]
MSAAATLPHPAPAARYAYAPVSTVRLWARRDAPGPRRLWSLWLLLLGPAAASGLIAIPLSAVPVDVGGHVLHVTPYLPLAFGTLAALWLGFWWGAVPLFVSQVVLALAGGLGVGWALVLGLADPLGLGVLILAYQAAPASTTLRSPAAFAFFVVAAFVSVFTSSAGAFVWAYAAGLGVADTLATWQGWWLGSFLQHLLLVAPALLLLGPAVERWKRTAGLEPDRPATLSPGRMAFAFGVVLFGLAGYVLLVRYFGWESLELLEGAAPGVALAVEQLSLLQWITFLFIGLAGYFGYQVAQGWTATAEALAEANERLQEALTERELDQARLVEFAVEQEQASRAKDLFFSIISHDLRGPMGALLGLAEVAEHRLDRHDDGELVEMAALMHRSAENLYGLLINLLEWSRLQTGQMRVTPVWVDLHALAAATVEVLAAPAAEKGIWLKNRVAPGTSVQADETMLRSVLLNLVGNGLKFTPEGGSVTVRAERGDGVVAVTVEDTGVGMSGDDVERLFRVEQTRSRTGTAGERGSGLGLVLCKEMIERHGGAITVQSAPGAGSRFRFTLPLTLDGAGEDAEGEAALAEAD